MYIWPMHDLRNKYKKSRIVHALQAPGWRSNKDCPAAAVLITSHLMSSSPKKGSWNWDVEIDWETIRERLVKSSSEVFPFAFSVGIANAGPFQNLNALKPCPNG